MKKFTGAFLFFADTEMYPFFLRQKEETDMRKFNAFALLLAMGITIILSGCSPPKTFISSSHTPDIEQIINNTFTNSSDYSGTVTVANKDGYTADIGLSGLYAASNDKQCVRGLVSVGIESEQNSSQNRITTIYKGNQVKSYLNLTDDMRQALFPNADQKADCDSIEICKNISIVQPVIKLLKAELTSAKYTESTGNPVTFNGFFYKSVNANDMNSLFNNFSKDTTTNLILKTSCPDLLDKAKVAINGAKTFQLSVVIKKSEITEISIKSENWDKADNGTYMVTGKAKPRNNIDGLFADINLASKSVSINDIPLPKNPAPYSGGQ